MSCIVIFIEGTVWQGLLYQHWQLLYHLYTIMLGEDQELSGQTNIRQHSSLSGWPPMFCIILELWTQMK